MMKMYELNLTEGKNFLIVYQAEEEDLIYSLEFAKGQIYSLSKPKIEKIIQDHITRHADYFFESQLGDKGLYDPARNKLLIDPRKHVGYIRKDGRVVAIGYGEFVRIVSIEGFFVEGDEETVYKATKEQIEDDGTISYYEGMALIAKIVNTYSFTNFDCGSGPIFAGVGSESSHYKTLILGFVPKLLMMPLKNKKVQRVVDGLIRERKEQVTVLETCKC